MPFVFEVDCLNDMYLTVHIFYLFDKGLFFPSFSNFFQKIANY